MCCFLSNRAHVSFSLLRLVYFWNVSFIVTVKDTDEGGRIKSSTSPGRLPSVCSSIISLHLPYASFWNWVVSMATKYLMDRSAHEGQSAARVSAFCCGPKQDGVSPSRRQHQYVNAHLCARVETNATGGCYSYHKHTRLHTTHSRGLLQDTHTYIIILQPVLPTQHSTSRTKTGSHMWNLACHMRHKINKQNKRGRNMKVTFCNIYQHQNKDVCFNVYTVLSFLFLVHMFTCFGWWAL